MSTLTKVCYRVRKLEHLNDLESYAGGSVATSRASQARQVKGKRSDEETCPGPPGWRLKHWTSNPVFIKT